VIAPCLPPAISVDEIEKTNLDPQHILRIPPFRGIRLQTMSYVEYDTNEKEFYDINADPYQLQNLAPKADPKLLTQLSARVKEMMTCKASACRTAEDSPINLPASDQGNKPPSLSTTSHAAESTTGTNQTFLQDQVYIIAIAIVLAAAILAVVIYARRPRSKNETPINTYKESTSLSGARA
jgi:hypothetical protein